MKRLFTALFVVLVLGIAWLLTIFSIPYICRDSGRTQCQKNKESHFRLPVYRM